MSISGCSTFTEPARQIDVITQVDLIYVLPPAAYLSPCESPFYMPPKTYSEKESAVREVTWKSAFDRCAKRIDKVKEWYESKQSYK
ncbi:Rz1-like lysis system protein LysC [Vibrio metschnikovii]|uniref:Rz1-like lysis system protein LysC n=1 Tax=Vibrio metschnikovii TaxID=28172 RepID=UPI003CCAD2ED